MRSRLAMMVLGVVLGVVATLMIPGFHPRHDHASAPGPAGSEQVAVKQLWTCSMHPQIIQDHPGNCPICGMKLVPLRRQEPESGAAADANPQVTIDPVTVQNMGIQTGVVAKGPLQRDIRLVGVVGYDETTLSQITTKFKGWVEKLEVNVTGQQVHRGDALFEIYSPEMYTAQAEYLLAVKQPGGHGSENDFVRASARTKLKFFDIGDDQIAELEKSGRPMKTLTIRAPHDGIVMEKMVLEGQMVEPGMKLFQIADISTVWVLGQVYEQDVPYLRLGQDVQVTLSYQPDRTYHGRVTYIYPTVDEQTRTVKVRMEFHNPGYALKPGMFTSVTLKARLAAEALLVPDMAVLRSGESNTVFVARDKGRFEPRKVVLGPRGDAGQYQVVSGLAEGERIVISGQFMLDSESQLREAIRKMTGPAAASPALAQAAPPPAKEQAGPASGPDQVAAYVCPMPEHASITYRHPGQCPLCNMALVPVSAEYLASVQGEGQVEYYTCPMPEHSDVHEKNPGRCPRCGMTLVPKMKAAALSPQQAAPAKVAPAASPKDAAAKVWYVCPMPQDADVRSDKPGKCPKCGMDLVPAAGKGK